MKPNIAPFFLILLVGCMEPAEGEEVIIHDGPTVSIPDAILYSPQSNQQGGKSLQFRYQFSVDSKRIEGLPVPKIDHDRPLVSAERAIELASATVGSVVKAPVVLRLELKEFRGVPLKNIGYYLITLSENGSEIHRVVLMDGSVIKPQMKEVKS